MSDVLPGEGNTNRPWLRGLRDKLGRSLLGRKLLLPKLLACGLLFFVAIWLVNGTAPRPDATGHPNVLFISVDTLRADRLSIYGYERPTSPRLESFVREATLFENARSHWPATLQSHMSMFTSLFPRAHAVDRGRGVSESVPMLAEYFKHAGYRTAGFYSLSWLQKKYGFARGYDDYGFRGKASNVQESALEFIGPDASAKAPFFLFFHIREVHSGPGMEKEGKPLYPGPPKYRDAFLPHPEVEVEHLSMDIWRGNVRLNEKELANVRAQYDGGVLHADAILEETFAELRQRNAFDNTLIVITSDHGEAIGDRGMFGHGNLWDEALHVPLLVKFPVDHPEREQWKGKRLNYPVQLIDLAPTILRLVDLPQPEHYQGRDLFSEKPRDIMAQQGENYVLIRDGYKLRWMTESDRLFLFNLGEDPGELNDLSESERDRANAMREALRFHLDAQRRYVPGVKQGKVELSAKDRKRLKSLGYLN